MAEDARKPRDQTHRREVFDTFLHLFSQVGELFLQCACEVNEPAHILLGDDLFGRHAAKKKRAMWTPKWCLKSGPRFGAREKKKQFGGPRNGVQILHPILGSTLPIIFREVTPEKLTF